MAPVTEHRYHENGERIRRARERIPSPRDGGRPISQEDFAPILGASRRHLIRLENGEQRPSGSLRDRIVEITGTEEQIEADDDEEEDALDAWLLRSARILRDGRNPLQDRPVAVRLGPSG